MIVAATAAYVYTIVRTPSYVSSQVVLVQPQSPDSALGSSNTGVLVETYGTGDAVQTAMGLFQGDEILERTAQALGEGVTAGEVEHQVSLERQGESRLIKVSARASDPGVASRMATSYTVTALQLHDELVRENARERGAAGSLTEEVAQALELIAQQGDPSLLLLSSAAVSAQSEDLSRPLAVAAGAIIGFMIGVALVLLRQRSETWLS